MGKEEQILECHICGADERTAKKLLSENGSIICDACVEMLHEVIALDNLVSDPINEIKEVKNTPSNIKSKLDEYVIGHDRAKKILSVAACNHYKRLEGMRNISTVDLTKSNIILIGSTGCGKTLMVETLAKILKVPFASSDANHFTEAGYVGGDAETVLTKLLMNSRDLTEAERGIVYIDELDKLVSTPSGGPSNRGSFREGAQQALLKMIEGTKMDIPVDLSKGSQRLPSVEIDTTNILFICSGAFEGMTDMILKQEENTSIGFGAKVTKLNSKQKNDLYAKITSDHLTGYGLLPELVGRLPIIGVLKALDVDALVRILTEPKDAIIGQFQELFKLDKVKLTFTKTALEAIALKAIKKSTGARGLRAIVEDLLLDEMFNLPDYSVVVKEIVINEKVITCGDKPKIIKR